MVVFGEACGMPAEWSEKVGLGVWNNVCGCLCVYNASERVRGWGQKLYDDETAADNGRITLVATATTAAAPEHGR